MVESISDIHTYLSILMCSHLWHTVSYHLKTKQVMSMSVCHWKRLYFSHKRPQLVVSGIWRKDLDASDSAGYEAMLDALGLNGLQRTTARLIEGMEIKHSPGEAFEVSFLTVVPFFKASM